MKLGSSDINKVYLGTTEINEIYLGSTLVYETGVVPPAGGWDLANASYDSKSKSVAAQNANMFGFTLSADGTKMYTCGIIIDSVFQYTLSTAFDISTASYDSVTLSTDVGGSSNSVYLHFKPDGTKLYVFNFTGDKVVQFTLSTPWDISTGSYDSKNFSGAAQDSNIRSAFLSEDGTKMYMVGDSNDFLYQYTLSTAWDVSTASYASKSLNVSAVGGNPRAFFFKPDGLTLFGSGLADNTIIQYNLSTAWDISTATVTAISYTPSETTQITAFVFKDDGTKLYIHNGGDDTVYQYTVPAP